MNKQITFYLLLLPAVTLMASLQGCDKDKCAGAKKTSAQFRVYNELYYYDKINGERTEITKIVEEDTLMAPSYVTFEALEANASSYEWTIGSDPRKRTTRKVTLFFADESVADYNPIIIKLKINKTPDKVCFPNDTGVDSVTQKIYFLKRNQWPLYGRYMGSDNTDPNNKFVIEILNGKKDGFSVDSIRNLPNACTNLSATIAYKTAFEFAIGEYDLNGFKPTPNCVFRDLDKKVGYLKSDRRTIVIDYEFTGKDESDKSLQRRTFTGIKL